MTFRSTQSSKNPFANPKSDENFRALASLAVHSCSFRQTAFGEEKEERAKDYEPWKLATRS